MFASLSALANLRMQIERKIAAIPTALFGWTFTAGSSELGDVDRMEKADGTDPDGNGKKGQRPVTRVQPFGLGSRQPSGLRGLWHRLGSSNLFFVGIGPQTKYGPQHLKVGETCLYNKGDASVYLDEDDKVTIKAGTSTVVVNKDGTVELNGNSYSAILDSIIADLKAWIDAANTVLGSNCVNGATLTSFAAQATALALFSTKLGVPDAYKSTKVKNG